MRTLRWSVCFLLCTAMAVMAAACGGDDNDGTLPTATSEQPSTTTREPAGPTATSADTGASDESLDVCSFLSPEEVSAAIGVDAPAGEAEDPVPPFFGCQWDTDQQLLKVSIIAWATEDDAKGSMNLETENNDYPVIEGLGDEAFNTQPIDDVTARSGRYEISVGLYFVSDDDAEELKRATEVARLIVDRLQ